MKHGDSMMVSESWTGPRYHIAVVVDSLLCGLVGKIVARLEEIASGFWAMSSAGRALGVACVI